MKVLLTRNRSAVTGIALIVPVVLFLLLQLLPSSLLQDGGIRSALIGCLVIAGHQLLVTLSLSFGIKSYGWTSVVLYFLGGYLGTHLEFAAYSFFAFGGFDLFFGPQSRLFALEGGLCSAISGFIIHMCGDQRSEQVVTPKSNRAGG